VREAREPIGFNLIEAFDQPWKRRLEGPMGGAWGLFDAQGRLRVPMQGDQPPDPRAPWVLGAALAGVLAALAAALVARRRDGTPEQRDRARLVGPWGVAVLAISGAWLAALAALQALTVVQGGRSALEAVALALAAGVSAAAGIAAAASLAARDPARSSSTTLGGGARSPTATLGTVPDRPGGMRLHAARAFGSIPVALLFTAAVLALWNVFDGRYRPLPWAFLAGPALLWALQWTVQGAVAGCRHLDGGPATPAARALAWVLVAAGPALLWIEGLANPQALATVGALALLAVPVLWPRAATAAGHGGAARSPRRDAACTHPSNATSAAGAASDAL
jgi:hypothetical protein